MSTSRDANSGGLGPKLPAACLLFLQASLEGRVDTAHTATCGACAERHLKRQRLQVALRSRPHPPAGLASRSMIEATFERIVEGAESSSPVAAWIGDRRSVPDPVHAWPEPLLNSPVGAVLDATPPLPPATVWTSLERDLIATLESRRMGKPRRQFWLGAAAIAAAASAVIWLLPVDAGPSTTIVFVDLDKPPAGDYPWLGLRR